MLFNPEIFISKGPFTCFLFMSSGSGPESEGNRKVYALNFMLQVMKGKHKFWMNATYCDGNYANEFSIDFLFSFFTFSAADHDEWQRNVDEESALCESLAEECQTAKNYQPRKQFRWVNQQHIFQHVKVTVERVMFDWRNI